ncbi:MAG: CPBP family glutamic-type intramembrane protease, partial [Eubacteriales bacterium]|nr:CPBP family glutamic-type intramembrane protease [Eubacteriales bacterium]
ISGIFNISILPGGQSAVREVVSNLPTIPGILLLAVSAPFVLELTFRESIIGVSERSRKFRLFLTSLISVVAFVFIQISRPREFWFYLPLAVILTAFYRRYDRNVWASATLYAFINVISYLLIRFVPAFSSF